MPGGFWMSTALCNPVDVNLSLSTLYAFGTTLTPSATANTKGAYAQLTAATTVDADAVMIRINYSMAAAGTSTMLVDLAVGASGQEKIILPDLHATGLQFAQVTSNFMLPLQIPKGTRIAARCQTTGASSTNTVNIGITLYSAGWSTNEGVAGFDAITTLTGAPPVATVVTPTVSATKSAWVQVNAATTRDYCGLLLNIDNQALPDTTNFPGLAVDVGIGAAASEQVIVANLAVTHAAGSHPYFWFFIPVDIPRGTRVAVRAALSTVSATYKCGVALYGAYH